MKITINENLKKILMPIFTVTAIVAIFLLGVLFQKVNDLKGGNGLANKQGPSVDKEKVIPTKGFDLPISWGDLGPKLISLGVIDQEKFNSLRHVRVLFAQKSCS